jgi:hypothetical protein
MTSERHFWKKNLLRGLLRLLLLGTHVVGLFSVVALSIAEAQSGKPEGLYYKSWAIIIGIEHYVVAPPIPGAISDAKKVAEAFRRVLRQGCQLATSASVVQRHVAEKSWAHGSARCVLYGPCRIYAGSRWARSRISCAV